MAPTAANLAKYLISLTGAPVELTADPTAADSLPAFLGAAYDAYRGSLFGAPYLFLCSKGAKTWTASQIAKHASIVSAKLGHRTAFVYPHMSPSERKQLIQRQVSFIVPGRQTYLPLALIDLRERAKGGGLATTPPSGTFSAPAQALLLFQLQKKRASGAWPAHRWAKELAYSRMTLSRAVRQLASAGLCSAPPGKREKPIEFLHCGAALWQAALPHLASPVSKRAWCTLGKHVEALALEAGTSALARVSQLSAGRTRVVAVSPTTYREAARTKGLVPLPTADEASALVERWRYAPETLSPDGHTVDRLSLYLSLREDPDERVQAALDQLMEQTEW
jgi:hypothetical protein